MEAVTENCERVKLLVHLAMNFLNRFDDGCVIWITCGKRMNEWIDYCVLI